MLSMSHRYTYHNIEHIYIYINIYMFVAKDNNSCAGYTRTRNWQ